MTVPTPPAVSEAMREAVAPTIRTSFISATVDGVTASQHEVCSAQEVRVFMAWAASEIARLTGERDAAREQRDSLKIALSDEVEAHVEAGEQLAAAEATLSRLQADRDAEVGRIRSAFRVNLLRYAPEITHADIDAMLGAALTETPDA